MAESAKPNVRRINTEESFRLLVESVKDYAIFLLDPDGYIMTWNRGAERIKGYSESEIIGKHFSTFYPDEANAIDHPAHELELAKEHGRYEEEGIRIRKDGTTFHANVVITALYDDQNVLRGFAKVTRDITERKKAEEELRRANEELERRVEQRTRELEAAKDAAESANRAKTEFLANMSHEIRTPLGAVIGFSEVLVHGDQTPEEMAECRDAIIRNGRLLVSIINDILDLSKIEAGHLNIEKTNVHLGELISQVAGLANLQAQEKGLEFRVESEGRIPIAVETDPVRLKQILLNVIGNAIKFTSRGSVRVTVREMAVEGALKLFFVVEDTGPGIAPEAAGKIFAPFSQVDSSLTRRFGGTGLGLMLSRRLARALGGDVVLTESRVGEGSTFTVSIATGVERSVLFGGKRPEPEESEDVPCPDLSGHRVLLVEDVYDNRALVKKYLQAAGATVTCAENGREGLEKALQDAFDIVLMDLSMPVMDGYEATHKLRESGFRKPIIALTAHALNDDRQRCLTAEFNDHVPKPIDRKILFGSLARLLLTD